jgi:hypothetical protein
MPSKPQIRLLKKKDSPPATSLKADLEVTSASDLTPIASPSDVISASDLTAIASPSDIISDLDITPIAPLPIETISSTVEDSVTPLTESNFSGVPTDSLSDEPELPLFQAIGVLFGAIQLNETDGAFYVRVDDSLFRLFFPKSRFASFALWFEAQQSRSGVYLMVYPKFRWVSNSLPEVWFEPVRWKLHNPWGEPNVFTFRGIWQSLSDLQPSMLSVYRNAGSRDPSGRFKASHFPVVMAREDGIVPFCFDPLLPKKQQPPRWFIQALFRFSASENTWVWVADLLPPSTWIPPYEKPNKQHLKGKTGSNDADKSVLESGI